MTDIAACDGQWCPARDLCERARLFDESTSSHQTYHLVPREMQVRGVECQFYAARREVPAADDMGAPCAGGGA